MSKGASEAEGEGRDKLGVGQFSKDIQSKLDSVIEELLECASEGEVDGVTALLEGLPEIIDSVDKDGFSALMIAAAQGHDKVVKYLLSAGADLHLTTYEASGTALHFAAKGGNVKCVKVLLGADPSLVHARTNDGDTPLIWATLEGHLETTVALLKAGSDPFISNSDTATPLMCAAMVEGVDKDDTKRALMIRALLDANAAMTSKHNQHIRGDYVNSQDIEGSTALHLAALGGNFKCVKMLLEYKADITRRNHRGETALQEAVRAGREVRGGQVDPEFEEGIKLLTEAWEKLEEEAHSRAMALLELEGFGGLEEVKKKKKGGAGGAPVAASTSTAAVSTTTKKSEGKKKKGKVKKPKTTAAAAALSHAGIQCDGCYSESHKGKTEDIVGDRYKCNVCVDFDLCEACYQARQGGQKAIHDLEGHSFTRLSLLAASRVDGEGEVDGDAEGEVERETGAVAGEGKGEEGNSGNTAGAGTRGLEESAGKNGQGSDAASPAPSASVVQPHLTDDDSDEASSDEEALLVNSAFSGNNSGGGSSSTVPSVSPPGDGKASHGLVSESDSGKSATMEEGWIQIRSSSTSSTSGGGGGGKSEAKEAGKKERGAAAIKRSQPKLSYEEVNGPVIRQASGVDRGGLAQQVVGGSLPPTPPLVVNAMPPPPGFELLTSIASSNEARGKLMDDSSSPSPPFPGRWATGPSSTSRGFGSRNKSAVSTDASTSSGAAEKGKQLLAPSDDTKRVGGGSNIPWGPSPVTASGETPLPSASSSSSLYGALDSNFNAAFSSFPPPFSESPSLPLWGSSSHIPSSDKATPAPAASSGLAPGRNPLLNGSSSLYSSMRPTSALSLSPVYSNVLDNVQQDFERIHPLLRNTGISIQHAGGIGVNYLNLNQLCILESVLESTLRSVREAKLEKVRSSEYERAMEDFKRSFFSPSV